MRAGFRSTTGNSRRKKLAAYVAGLASAGAVVYLLDLHGGALRIVFPVVAVVVALLASLVLNTRRMTPQELGTLEQELHDVPLHDVRLGHHVELKFGSEHTKEREE